MNFRYMYLISSLGVELFFLHYHGFTLIGAAIRIVDRRIDPCISRIISTNVDLKAGIRRKRKEPSGPKMSLKEQIQFIFQLQVKTLSAFHFCVCQYNLHFVPCLLPFNNLYKHPAF